VFSISDKECIILDQMQVLLPLDREEGSSLVKDKMLYPRLCSFIYPS